MPNFITKAFSKFDIFGSEVGLNFQKDSVFKTTFGGFISLGFVAFIGIFFWSNIFSFLHKENVTANSMKIYNINPPVSGVTSKTFMFAVKIDHDNFINKPLFNLTLEKRDYNTLANGTKIRNKFAVPLEPCTLEHWMLIPTYGQNITELYSRYSFKDYLCPRISEQLMLGGNYNSEHFYHWKFGVSKCSNNYPSDSLWKPQCLTDAEVNDYFNKNQNVRFNLFINNFVINPLNNENPIGTFIEDSLFFSIQKSGAYQTADIFLTDNHLQTDKSILPFQDIQEEHFLIFQNGNFRPQYVIGPTSSSVADFFIRKDAFSYEITRSFQKVSEIISYIGGFSQIFILITAIIVNFYNEYVYAISLANKIYDFQYTDYQSRKSKMQTNQIVKSQGNKQNEKTNQPKLPQSTINNNNNNNNIQNVPLTVINEDIENNTHFVAVNKFDNVKLKDEQDSPRKRNKQKKITTREELGLLPLEQIKSIINQRKTYIEQNQIKQNNQDKGKQNKSIIQKQTSLELKELDKFEKYHKQNIFSQNNEQNIEDDQLSKYLYETKCYKDEVQKSQKIIQLFANNQNNAEKIKFKQIMNDSIIPESPLKEQHHHTLQNNQEKQKNKLLSDFTHIEYDNNEEKENSLNNEDRIQIVNNIIQNEKLSQLMKVKTQIMKRKNEQSNYDNNKHKQIDDTINNQLTNAYQINSPEQLDIVSLDMIQINSNQALNKNIERAGDNTNRAGDNTDRAGDDMRDNKFNSNNNILLQGLGFRDKKQFLKREFEFLLSKDSSIKMTYKFFLYKLTCGKLFRTEQVLLLDKANKQMKNDLDIFMIINRLKELEKFKTLFLDSNQQILFNFFPKPVLSVHMNDEQFSLAEMTEQVKNRNDSIGNDKNVKVKGKQQKMLNINFKTAVLVSKAATQFKKPLTKKINKFDNMVAYQKLHDAYEYVRAQEETIFNKKLIEQLGEEMNKIFEISNMIVNKGGTAGKSRQTNTSIQNFDSNIGFTALKSERTLKGQQLQKNQSIFKQQQLLQEIVSNEYIDSNTKRNCLLSEEGTQIQTTERKL